jgi:3-dehydroquinate synthase
MKTVQLKLDSGCYNILIGSGLLRSAGRLVRDAGFEGRMVVVTDEDVANYYGNLVRQSLEENGFKTDLLTVPAGEEQKSLESAGRLYHLLSGIGAERSTPVIALGGGVIGDLAGFVAATFKRGVPFIQMPTTLLAQIDSSVGGKVAVDQGHLKNEIGAFYQPRLVISDIAVLHTLPKRELSSGLAEIIKHAVIADKDLFAYLENNIERVMALDEQALEEVIYRSVKIKAAVVMKDERDTGLRNTLNYGHTVGHAVETVSDFTLRHGEAVAIGMLAAGKISCKMGLWDNSGLDRLKKVIEQAGLPVKVPDFNTEKIIEVMQHDKKVAGGRVKFVLLKSIGEVYVTDRVEMTLVREVLNEFHSST